MRVVEAAGGEAAFAVLEEFTQSRKEDPALLVLDLMMPVMSGVEVVERLRRTSRWARLPVLLMTAANDPMLPMMLKAPVVFKPDTDALLNAVRKTLIRHQVTPNAKVDSAVEGNFPRSNRDARARFKRRAL
jgi:CheY-like chemotaxis protein